MRRLREAITPRLSATAGHVGALLLGVTFVLARAAPWGVALAERLRGGRPLRTDIVAFPSRPTTQFETYVVAVVLFAATIAAFGLLRRALAKYAQLLDAVALLAGVALAVRASDLLADVSVPLVVVAGALVSWHVLPATPARPRASVDASVAFVLVVEAIAGVWAVWLVSFADPRTTMFAIVAFAALVVQRRSADRTRDAIAGAPLLLSPLIGLMRAPLPRWTVGLFVMVLLVYLIADRPRVRTLLTPPRLVVGAAWCVAAIYATPCQFRDFGSLNLHDHESGAYAWVNSVFHRKLMMADAGTIYGPLRTYSLAAFLRIFGSTIEHARIAQILVNLIAIAVLLAVVWSFARGKTLVLLWGVYLLFAVTYVGHWLDPGAIYSFGWADVGRVAFPLGAVVAGSAFLTRRDAKPRIVAFVGFLTGLSFFWAQEASVPAVLALAAAGAAEVLLGRDRSFRERLREGARTAGILATGGLMAAFVFLAPYVALGRLRAFFATAAETAKIFASGEYGGLAVQFGPATFRTWSAAIEPLAREAGGRAIDAVLPALVLCIGLAAMIAAGAASAWTPRRTRLLAVIVFGLASQRVALARADFVHVGAAAVPAVIVVCALSADALLAIETGESPAAMGAVGMAILLFTSLYAGGFGFVLGRTKALVRGDEHPSIGNRYDHPYIPRAGDVYVPPELEKLVLAIRQRTEPRDAIFVRQHPLRGPEIYFLANRRNPTMFDVLCEITHTAQQDQAEAQLRRDPPKLVIGTSDMVGPSLHRYLAERYPVTETFGEWTLAAPR